MADLNIRGVNFLSIDEAEKYLEYQPAIYRLDNVYFKCKSFVRHYRLLPKPIKNSTIVDRHRYLDPSALLIEPDKQIPIVYYDEGMEVYIDGLIKFSMQEVLTFEFENEEVYLALFVDFLGTLNGRDYVHENGSFFSMGPDIKLNTSSNKSDSYIKLSDLDAFAKKFGIKKTIPVKSTSINLEAEKIIISPSAIERENDFNGCIFRAITSFIAKNEYKPTVDTILNELRNNPPISDIVNFKVDTLSINGAEPRQLGNVKRTIKSLLDKA